MVNDEIGANKYRVKTCIAEKMIAADNMKISASGDLIFSVKTDIVSLFAAGQWKEATLDKPIK